MATLFPDRHFHEGGDEISGADWKANSRVEEFMRTNGLMTLGELESYFFDRVRKGVVAHGKTAVYRWQVDRLPASLVGQRIDDGVRAGVDV